MSKPLLTPRRTVTGRGSRTALFDVLDPVTGPICVVHSRSADWAGEVVTRLRQTGREVVTVTASGEPSLPDLQALLSDLRPRSVAAVTAIGGGSAIDLGKALSALLPGTNDPLDHLEVVGRGLPLAHAPLPFIALPTTAGTGAEATKNAVIDVPEHRRKVSLRDDRMIPRLAILDPDLTANLPWPVTLMTGMDAVTQLIEPYLCTRATPATDALCRAAIEPAMRALISLSKGEGPQARDTMIRAAHLSGIALANAGLGAVHGLAGIMGGKTGAPHGAICARLLPHVLEANRTACDAAGLDTTRFEEVDGMISRAFGTPGRAAELIHAFLDGQPLPDLSGPTPLDVAETAQEAQAASSMKANPVDLSSETLAALVRAVL